MFLVPANMQSRWAGSGMSAQEDGVLLHTVQHDLGAPNLHLHRPNSDCERDDGGVCLASIPLGKLGKGVLVRVRDRNFCDAAGNCFLYLYVGRGGEFRQVDFGARREWPVGWASGVIGTHAPVPDLVVAFSLGGGMQLLTRYHYSGKKFVPNGCDALRQKKPNIGNWFDPAQVDVLPCRKR